MLLSLKRSSDEFDNWISLSNQIMQNCLSMLKARLDVDIVKVCLELIVSFWYSLISMKLEEQIYSLHC